MSAGCLEIARLLASLAEEAVGHGAILAFTMATFSVRSTTDPAEFIILKKFVLPANIITLEDWAGPVKEEFPALPSLWRGMISLT